MAPQLTSMLDCVSRTMDVTKEECPQTWEGISLEHLKGAPKRYCQLLCKASWDGTVDITLSLGGTDTNCIYSNPIETFQTIYRGPCRCPFESLSVHCDVKTIVERGLSTTGPFDDGAENHVHISVTCSRASRVSVLDAVSQLLLKSQAKIISKDTAHPQIPRTHTKPILHIRILHNY
jgi:hypothetical protein